MVHFQTMVPRLPGIDEILRQFEPHVEGRARFVRVPATQLDLGGSEVVLRGERTIREFSSDHFRFVQRENRLDAATPAGEHDRHDHRELRQLFAIAAQFGRAAPFDDHAIHEALLRVDPRAHHVTARPRRVVQRCERAIVIGGPDRFERVRVEAFVRGRAGSAHRTVGRKGAPLR